MRIAGAQEAEVAVSQDNTTVLQPGRQSETLSQNLQKQTKQASQNFSIADTSNRVHHQKCDMAPNYA